MVVLSEIKLVKIVLVNRLYQRCHVVKQQEYNEDADETRDSRYGKALTRGQRETPRSSELRAVRLWSGGKSEYVFIGDT